MRRNKDNSRGIKLLKRGRIGAKRALFSRIFLILFFLTVQVILLVLTHIWFRQATPHYTMVILALTVLMILYLLNSQYDPTAKITWLIVIMVLPVFGALLLLHTTSDVGHRVLKRSTDKMLSSAKDIIKSDEETVAAISKADTGAASISRYLSSVGGFSVFREEEVRYFSSGEEKFEELKKRLEAAKKYIFLEYFIINEGTMWGETLEILVRKVKEGVDVRVMYDGTNAIHYLSRNYPKLLNKLGIKCKVFEPIYPIISTRFNYRDHRKIVAIDGEVAFTGGINLSDEYINEATRFGHWKDAGVMVCGEAAKSFTLMFLQMWDLRSGKVDFTPYEEKNETERKTKNGFVIPYADCPLDSYKTAKCVYMDIINRAQEHLMIMTPYLILDGELESALRFAAEKGVDVSIILPGIPDKKVPYALAKTHYKTLLSSGVKIYEYAPGFVHAKLMVADGKEAVVGTINFDYRSLYHHFECAAYLYGVECISDIERDFENTRELCRKVTKRSVKKEKPWVKLIGFIAKAIAPLL